MSYRNRSTHLWYIFSWGVILSFVVIVYHTLETSNLIHLTPSGWTIVDRVYKTILGVIITSIVASLTNFLFREVKYTFAQDHLVVRKFLPILRFLTILIIWIVGAFLILESLDINTSGLLAGAGIGGAIFAIASRDIIANILGSLSIVLSKNFEIGDTIRMRNYEGIVEEITMNATKIMNEDGKVVYIPNKLITNESLENLSRRRYFLHSFRVPFKKAIGNPELVRDRLDMIEGKISEYDPIDLIIKTDIPNANDFVYIFEVKMPEYDKDFDREIREFLVPYIFPEGEK